jgi:hypothetical protein
MSSGNSRRIWVVIHTRPFESIIGLCGLAGFLYTPGKAVTPPTAVAGSPRLRKPAGSPVALVCCPHGVLNPPTVGTLIVLDVFFTGSVISRRSLPMSTP